MKLTLFPHEFLSRLVNVVNYCALCQSKRVVHNVKEVDVFKSYRLAHKRNCPILFAKKERTKKEWEVWLMEKALAK